MRLIDICILRHLRRFRLVLVAALVLLALLASSSIALACEITTTPASATANVGDQQVVNIQVKLTHKNCLVPIDQTSITASGLKIVSQTAWKLSGSTYSKELTIVFTDPGQATLTVTRTCSKGGDIEKTTFTVKPAAVASADIGATAPDSQPAAAEVKQPSSVVAGSSQPAMSPAQGTPAVVPGSPARVTTPVYEPVQLKSVSLEDKQPDDLVSDKELANGDVGEIPIPASAQTGWQRFLAEPKLLVLIALLILASVLYIKGMRQLRRLMLVFSLAYLGFYLGGCLCPLGVIQNLALPEIAGGQKLAFLVLLGAPVLAALFLGRIFCGWICPAGAIQELVHYAKAAVVIPAKWDRWLKSLKYVALVLLVASTRITGEAVLKDIDPFKAAFNIGGSAIAVAGLALILVVSVFVYRPWCKYLCPVAVVFALASRLGVSRLVANSSCVSCRQCVKVCGAQALEIGPDGLPQVDSGECIACGACQEICRKDALRPDCRLPAGSHAIPQPATISHRDV